MSFAVYESRPITTLIATRVARRAPRRSVAAWVAALCVALSAGSALAQERLARGQVEQWFLDAVNVATDGSGRVELLVRALTATGQPAELIPPWPFEIEEDGERIDPSGVEAIPLDETDAGVACVLVIDVSPSVEQTFAQAKSAALRLVDRLRPVDRLAVLTVSGEVERLADWSSVAAEKRARIESLELDTTPAATRLYDAIQDAVDQLKLTPGLPQRRFVLVYSDGRDGGSVTTRDALLGQLARRGDGDVLLYTIAAPDRRFGRVDLSDLRQLAAETRTELREATGSYQLQAYFEEIWGQMVGSYIVRFETRMDGAVHEIAMRMAGKSETLAAQYPEGSLPLVAIVLVGVGALAFVLLLVWLLSRMASRRGGQLVMLGTGTEQAFPLRRGANQIGWLAENDIVLASPTVSRYHAIIHVYRDGVEIEDRSSLNGTLVNDKPVARAPLSPGDRVRFGDLEMVYRA
jgi:hypothetical protein